jgi:hypothetical protein
VPKLHRLAAGLAALVTLVFAATASATLVNVRVEGASKTYFEGQVDTTLHQVDGGDNTGAHECDGLNNGNPKGYAGPGPSFTGALDDAAHANGFSWYGTWNDFGIPDFYIRTIAGETPDPNTAFWDQVLNWKGIDVGGCQLQVQAGDDLVFAVSGFDANYNGWHLLELSGVPATAATGQSFTVHVADHDGSGGAPTPAAGASVGGATTGADGNAVVSFSSPGTYKLKATRATSIRSNAETVCVYTPGSGQCGTQPATQTNTGTTSTPTPGPAPAVKDTTPPVVAVTSLVPGKVYTRGPRLLSGKADDSGGIYQVFLRLRVTGGGPGKAAASRCRWFSGKRGVFTHRTVPCTRARFFRIGDDANWSYLLPARLRNGSYVLDVKVLDRSYNAGRSSVPFAVK